MENEITEVTRRTIVDFLAISDLSWSGRLQDDDFLARLYDLTKLPHTITDIAMRRGISPSTPADMPKGIFAAGSNNLILSYNRVSEHSHEQTCCTNCG